MSITSAKTGATGISLALDNNYMEPIATTSGGASTISFNDIPQGYKHLQIRMIGRLTNSGGSVYNANITFNGDNGTNYTWHAIRGTGSSVVAYASASQSKINIDTIFPDAGVTSNTFGAGVLDILDYGSLSKYKTVRAINGYDANGTGNVWFQSGVWMSNDPITSITIVNNGGYTFNTYSRFSLYGIKG
jgi:hypothetical protein